MFKLNTLRRVTSLVFLLNKLEWGGSTSFPVLWLLPGVGSRVWFGREVGGYSPAEWYGMVWFLPTGLVVRSVTIRLLKN